MMRRFFGDFGRTSTTGSHTAVVLVNPRALDAEVKARVAAAKPEEKRLLERFAEVWTALDSAKIVEVFRETLIPFFFLLTGLFIPDRIEATYPSA